MTADRRSRALTLVARRAPTIPPALLALLLAEVEHGDGDSILSTLLSRSDIPLDVLEPLAVPTSSVDPAPAASYISRPEHTPETIERLLDADHRPRVLRLVVARLRPNPDALRAALPLCGMPELRALASNRHAPVELRGQALGRYTDLATRDPDDQTELEELLERDLTPVLADAAAPLSQEPVLLAACALKVTSPRAADHVARVWLAPQLAAGLQLRRERTNELLRAGHRLLRAASPQVRHEMAEWWAAAEQTADDVRGQTSTRIADLIAHLRGAELVDRPWRATLSDELYGDPRVDLAVVLTDAFGDDPALWHTYSRLAGTFAGTVAELIDTVHAVATPQP